MENIQTIVTVAEGHELPSGGQIYDKKVNSHIELRAMNGADEMKVTAPSTLPLKVVADVIESCLVEKPAVKVYDMCSADYEFLLHKLRVVTYGPKYKMTTSCPHCENLVNAEANLDELVIDEIDTEKFDIDQKITLKDSNNVVELNFNTPRILDSIELKAKDLKKRYKNALYDFSTLSKLTLCIKTVNGEYLSDYALEDFINKLSAKDLRQIINSLDRLNSNFGIDTRLTVTCPVCGEEINTFFRFGQEFFSPTNV